MLLFAVLSALICHHALAQGPMFQPDPRASPQQAPNATLMFGDIAMTPEQMRAKELGPEAFNAVIGQHLRWKDAIIPYRIDCSIENYPDAVSAVKKAMAQWERKTCIRFVPYTNQKFKLTFFRNTHCWGNVGQVSYSRISVGPGCEYEHVMAHEIGHVVGLYHEQNRKDRDDWVNVFWENIGQFKDAFDIVKNTDPLGIQYDYESIMHYPWTAFSINGKPTMAPKRPTKGKIPYIEISHDDIELVSRMYNCPEIERKRKHHANRIRKRIAKSIENKFDAREIERKRKHHAMRVRKRIAKSVPNTFNREDCVERVRDCEDWAKQGRCHEPDVSRQCHRSCMARSCYGGPCTDGHVRDCPIWAKMGHCKFVDSVQMDCQKSCNPVCKGEKPLTPPPTKKPITFTFPTEPPHKKGDYHSWPNYNYLGTGFRCLDKHPQCPEWAKMGECRRNPGWMHRNCKKSCPDSRCDRTVLKPPGTCNNPMGISVDPEGKYQLPDSAMTATTMLSPGSGWHAAARNARLYFEDDYDNHRIAAWCPAHRVGQLTVDLGHEKTLTYIATQGRDQYFERVAEFQIQYSNDGQTFTTHKEKGQDRTFFGNCDHSTPVLNKFEDPIKARYIRYIPVESQYDNYPCVRMELYGC